MLVLSRRANEDVFIGDNIKVRVLKIEGNKVCLGFDAPKEIRIIRDDAHAKMRKGVDKHIQDRIE